MSVVICAYTQRRWDDLRSALASIERQTLKPLEIIVVVDNNDELFARLSESVPGVRALHNLGVRGAGESRNRGVQEAAGEIMAFLDDDAIAEPTWIANAVDALASLETLGVGGVITPAWELERPRWMAREFYWTVGCTYPGLPLSPAPVRNLIAANMFVRRAEFLELGGFRAGFGKTGLRSGTEETELCIRAAQRWPERVWLHHPDVRIRHRVPASRARVSYFVSRCYDEGLAKAAVVGFVGQRDGLAAERTYTRRTLPLGLLTGLRDGLHGNLWGFGRTLSIVVGLAATTAGYVVGRARVRGSRGVDDAADPSHV